jgi:hypothetical protein
MKVFERAHHQRIAVVLGCLDAPLLRTHSCLFGGGTAIALRFGEYRESVDIDFLVSDLSCYRDLREMLTQSSGLSAIFLQGQRAVNQVGALRADQYGIRTRLEVAGTEIKFEIVHEGRIALDVPGRSDEVLGVSTLTTVDLAASKLLANSDRWADDGIFSRDIIDLAMMSPSPRALSAAIAKAEVAYASAIRTDAKKALARLEARDKWFERCMSTMHMNLPKASVVHRLRRLQRLLASEEGA